MEKETESQVSWWKRKNRVNELMKKETKNQWVDEKGNLCVLEDFNPFERIKVHVDSYFPLQLVCKKKITSYLSIYVYHFPGKYTAQVIFPFSLTANHTKFGRQMIQTTFDLCERG